MDKRFRTQLGVLAFHLAFYFLITSFLSQLILSHTSISL